MKRIWIGLTILTFLLCLAFLFSGIMDRIYTPLGETLQEAAQAATQGDWHTAGELAVRAKAQWERHKCLTAALADHSPMDEMDGLFSELEVYLQQQEMPHFAATCQHLRKLSEAMGENHALNWWNVL